MWKMITRWVRGQRIRLEEERIHCLEWNDSLLPFHYDFSVSHVREDESKVMDRSYQRHLSVSLLQNGKYVRYKKHNITEEVWEETSFLGNIFHRRLVLPLKGDGSDDEEVILFKYTSCCVTVTVTLDSYSSVLLKRAFFSGIFSILDLLNLMFSLILLRFIFLCFSYNLFSH